MNRCPGCFEEYDGGRCAHCGFKPSRKPEFGSALPVGTVLYGQYLIGSVLGKPGGFGITYLAWDQRLHVRVAVKEFFPRDLAHREQDGCSLTPHSGHDAELYAAGLRQFVDEGSLVARFDHMNVVRVRNLFEAHGTAYLVMDYYQGETLAEYLDRSGGTLSEETAIAIMLPVLDGLRAVHDQGVLHRDLKLQNIYLTDQGRPILLDFGAARHAIGERSTSMTAILTPGFAPFEQYHRKGNHGPWTDIYGAAATLFTLLTGRVPPEASERVINDTLRIPDRLSAPIRDALRVGLAVSPEDRPETGREFQEILMGTRDAPPPPPPPSASQPPPTRRSAWVVGGAAAVALGIGAATVWTLTSQEADRLESTRATLTALQREQEQYRATFGRYAPSLSALQFQPDRTIDVQMLWTGRRAWSALAHHPRLDQSCVIMVGSPGVTLARKQAVRAPDPSADPTVICDEYDVTSMVLRSRALVLISVEDSSDVAVDGAQSLPIRPSDRFQVELVPGEHSLSARVGPRGAPWDTLVTIGENDTIAVRVAAPEPRSNPMIASILDRPGGMQLPYEDDFRSPVSRARHPSSASITCRRELETGALRIRATTDAPCMYRFEGGAGQGPLGGDARIEVTAEHLGGTGRYGFGLIFGYRPPVGLLDERYYVARLNAQGFASLYYLSGTDQNMLCTEGAALLDSGRGTPARLAVTMRGGTATLEVDSDYACEVDLDESRVITGLFGVNQIRDGPIGLWVGGGQLDVRFSNLRVTAIR